MLYSFDEPLEGVSEEESPQLFSRILNISSVIVFFTVRKDMVVPF